MNEYTKYLQVLCNQLCIKDKYGRALEEDGILGELTRKAIRRLPVLQRNTSGYKEKIAITHIQNVLKITADGIFGTATYNAVVSFQRKKGLSADGIVGPDTWVAFADPYGSNTTNPPSTGKLPTGWVMPIAFGQETGYDGDTGLDIAAPKGTTCYAAASVTIVYSEPGHTPWNKYPDTANSVLIRLDNSFNFEGLMINYIWYTHLSQLNYILTRDLASKFQLKFYFYWNFIFLHLLEELESSQTGRS